jgi:steroid delta-isomerase-like uncharacterized protein
MSTEENKALARQFIEEGFTKGNLAIADAIIAPNFANYDPGTPPLPAGPEGYKQLVAAYRTAYPNLQLSVDDLVAEGDKVAVRWTARGTHNGPLGDIPATGKQAIISGISVLTITGGKVAAQHTNWDTLGMLQQLGVIPTPG